jgi:cysteine desulfurase
MNSEHANYLDHNATSPLPGSVRAALLQAIDEDWGNPSSAHEQGQRAAMALDRARQQVAALGGWASQDVSFTGGATEANSWALSAVQHSARPEVVVSAVEHPSVLAWATRVVPVDSEGRIQLDALVDALDDRVGIISVMAANNETGVIQPTDAVAAIAAERGIPFHCDASQLPGRVDIELSADMITLAGHKFGAPPGVGALISAAPPEPLLRGGGQERGRRAGTHNLPGIVAMGAAAALVQQRGLLGSGERDALESVCVSEGARVLGAGAERLPNTCCVDFGLPGDLVVAALDLQGISASTGSACGSGAARSSHVVAAMGQSCVPVRFSFGWDSCSAPAARALVSILSGLRDACV